MKQYMIAIVLSLCLASLATGAAVSEPSNILSNGDFEEWVTYKSSGDTPICPEITDNLVPTDWTPAVEAYDQKGKPALPMNVAFSRDTKVRHAGSACARIQNGLGTDTGLLNSSQLSVLPDTTYRFSAWYKGEQIESGPDVPAGVCFGVVEGGENLPSSHSERLATPKTSDGTFDWRRIDIVFVTKPTTRKVVLNMQLRRAKGVAWFDDVQLTVVKPAVANLLANPGFEADSKAGWASPPTGWSTWTKNPADTNVTYSQSRGDAHSGSMRLTHWRSNAWGTVQTYQSFVNIPNGTYILRAWAKRTSNAITASLRAQDNSTGDFWESEIPVSASYRQVSVRVPVTHNQCTISLMSSSTAGNVEVYADDCEFFVASQSKAADQ